MTDQPSSLTGARWTAPSPTVGPPRWRGCFSVSCRQPRFTLASLLPSSTAVRLRLSAAPSKTRRHGYRWPRSVSVMVLWVDVPLGLIEFPADDPDRARRFWSDLLGVELAERSNAEGRGWQTHTGDTALGIHERGTGPGDTVSLPYFTIADMDAALSRVKALGGSVIHPGSRWSICRDSEGSPFALALDAEPS
jgi:uncharacterized protein